ncbi:MAG: hypothetical protein GYA14_14015 [Ignavibacteria bacterium]|nr:hypothetical protein [Ignavibacteria bacterium]
MKSDFCISDLTFARPSVYYESGYAERNIPVIYIVRKDHFRQIDSDIYGNFCIHFDLQKKNIIPWTEENTITFSKNLKKRIAFLTKPILKKIAEESKQKDEEDKFKTLSQYDKLSLLFLNTKNILLSGKYKIEKDSFNQIKTLSNISFWKIENSVLKIINVCFDLSFGVKYFDEIKWSSIWDSNQPPKRVERLLTNNLNNRLLSKIKDVNECWVLFSLKKVNSMSIKNTFSYYKVIDDNFISYDYKNESLGLRFDYKRNYILISGYKSISSFINELERMLLLFNKSK